MASRMTRLTHGSTVALLALLTAGSCGSGAMDRQVAAALAAAQRQDQQRGTRFAAEAIAAPAWLVGGPVAASDRDFRPAARRLAVQPQRWLAAADGAASTGGIFLVTGPNGRSVRVECDAAHFAAVDPVGLVDLFGSVAVDVAVHPLEPSVEVGTRSSTGVAAAMPNATEGSTIVLTVRLVAPDRTGALPGTVDLSTDLEVSVFGVDRASRGVATLVARTSAYDAGDAQSGSVVVAVHERTAVGPNDGGAPFVEIRVARDAADRAGEIARCIAFGCAGLLADPRAGDLGRYLLALDATYEFVAGESAAQEEATSGAATVQSAASWLASGRAALAGSGGNELEAWHREVRAELRRVCLGLAHDDAVLDAPFAAPVSRASNDDGEP